MGQTRAELNADLRKLAKIPDEEIKRVARRIWVKQVAEHFQVPFAVAEIRLEGIGPYRPSAKEV